MSCPTVFKILNRRVENFSYSKSFEFVAGMINQLDQSVGLMFNQQDSVSHLKEIISHAQGDHLFLKLANISVSFRNEFLDRVRSLSLDNLRHKKS